ncbi:MAG: YebC/PmpR family DNA-binding transcriptional regulator [Bacteroidota bacterium]|nr:YebC/PmpR family DNA-binding transcriptional regulator [Bacteroidota bacterium]MDP4225808.1 YebC/PmpR family DNA-binding transcriptional regulator [Bacteroidota bacterium]MDP4275451.1 YebC/PmpR family DNA-binding transcriptional regulator [Bacteroidota bacterium]
MSGHNKWSTIKRKKGALDAKRSKIFSKIIKEIMIAIKEGGPEPDNNPRLRLAIQNAKGVNMPKDNIQRAINKAKDSSALNEVSFEGYAPNGVAIFIECLTDNNQRTVSAIRSTFSKRGGNLGVNGSLSFLFDRKGVITIPKGDIDLEDFELQVIDAGVEDIDVDEDAIVLTTSMEDFTKVQKKLEEMKIEPENAELRRIPNDLKKLDPAAGVKVLKLVDEFEDNDDVQNVYHNLDISDEIIKLYEIEEQ